MRLWVREHISFILAIPIGHATKYLLCGGTFKFYKTRRGEAKADLKQPNTFTTYIYYTISRTHHQTQMRRTRALIDFLKFQDWRKTDSSENDQFSRHFYMRRILVLDSCELSLDSFPPNQTILW